MRHLHQHAKQQALAKQTELRLVLASRYRELVGSSDEVLHMQSRAQELQDLLSHVPQLLLQQQQQQAKTAENDKDKTVVSTDSSSVSLLSVFAHWLQVMPLQIHYDLQQDQLFKSCVGMLQVFTSIYLYWNNNSSRRNQEFPLCQVLAKQCQSLSLPFDKVKFTPKALWTLQDLADGTHDNQYDKDKVLLVQVQSNMTVLALQTLPHQLVRRAWKTLQQSASYGKALESYFEQSQSPVLDEEGKDENKQAENETDMALYGAERSACALAVLYMLQPIQGQVRRLQQARRQQPPQVEVSTTMDTTMTNPVACATALLDTYYESKARLLLHLLDQLSTSITSSKDDATGTKKSSSSSSSTTKTAETILSKIVNLLQYDIILHPYLIFCGNHEFPTLINDASDIVACLPPSVPVELVRSKCSKFLQTHLPLIRSKVKNILVVIAGTTASALGQIRQSLYDKTDGKKWASPQILSWWNASVDTLVNVQTVLSQAELLTLQQQQRQGGGGTSSSASGSSQQTVQQRFSLWSCLFSNTFSSLVHSLLTSAFQSVHSRVVSTLRASLKAAPKPLSTMLPHEAHANTLRIAVALDTALQKVSDDAHELLVHAEEREESERRLRQSLYVQTCEIMGRLVCELRRMVEDSGDSEEDATKEWIVGRLCYLLKFRLTSLPTLLDPKSSPAAIHSAMHHRGAVARGSGMISIVDIQSAFDLADDNTDGLISFEEAMEAVESAFSGTQFRGAEMVRETLLLHSSPSKNAPSSGGLPSTELISGPASSSNNSSTMASNVTLHELILLVARGLRHEESGKGSALGTIQQSLDDIVVKCFRKWSYSALRDSASIFQANYKEFLSTSCTVDDKEWQRLHPVEGQSIYMEDSSTVRTVSPFVVGHILDVSSTLNRMICPSDTLSPVPSPEYAVSMGIEKADTIPSLADNVRWALLCQSLVGVASMLHDELSSLQSTGLSLEKSGPSALVQHYNDTSFLYRCFTERNINGFGPEEAGHDENVHSSLSSIEQLMKRSGSLLRSSVGGSSYQKISSIVPEGHKHVFAVSELAFASLFGEVSGPTSSDLDISGSAAAAPLYRPPLASSRRFALLPVQADRSLQDIQLRAKYAKEKQTASTTRNENVGAKVVTSGLGFLSSMLKKN